MRFDANKRGLFHVVRSQSYGIATETTHERQESIYAVIAVAVVLLGSLAFLLAWWIG